MELGEYQVYAYNEAYPEVDPIYVALTADEASVECSFNLTTPTYNNLLTGYVTDWNGNGVTGVYVYADYGNWSSDDVLVDENGYYEIQLPDYDSNYSMVNCYAYSDDYYEVGASAQYNGTGDISIDLEFNYNLIDVGIRVLGESLGGGSENIQANILFGNNIDGNWSGWVYTNNNTYTFGRVRGRIDCNININPSENSIWDGFVTSQNIDSDSVLEYTLTRKSYNTTIGTDGGGTVDLPTGVRSDKYGASFSITATPDDGYTFMGWSINGTLNRDLPSTITYNVVNTTTLTAVFGAA